MSDAENTLASEFDTLRGRVLGLIESWGLPEKQESGAKATFKSLTYDAQSKIDKLIKE
jgi:hypothetical protein